MQVDVRGWPDPHGKSITSWLCEDGVMPCTRPTADAMAGVQEAAPISDEQATADPAAKAASSARSGAKPAKVCHLSLPEQQ